MNQTRPLHARMSACAPEPVRGAPPYPQAFRCALIWPNSGQKQPGVRRYPLIHRYRPPLFLARCPGYVGRHASPEASSTLVLLLEGDPPASGVETQKLQGGRMPDALPPRRPDHEELPHNLQLLGQATNQRKASKGLTTVNQVAA